MDKKAPRERQIIPGSSVKSWSTDGERTWIAKDANEHLVGSVIAGCGYYRPSYRCTGGCIRALDGEPTLDTAQRIVERSAVSPMQTAVSLEIPSRFSPDLGSDWDTSQSSAQMLANALASAAEVMGVELDPRNLVGAHVSVWPKVSTITAQLTKPEGFPDWEDRFHRAILDALAEAKLMDGSAAKISIHAVELPKAVAAV